MSELDWADSEPPRELNEDIHIEGDSEPPRELTGESGVTGDSE